MHCSPSLTACLSCCTECIYNQRRRQRALSPWRQNIVIHLRIQAWLLIKNIHAKNSYKNSYDNKLLFLLFLIMKNTMRWRDVTMSGSAVWRISYRTGSWSVRIPWYGGSRTGFALSTRTAMHSAGVRWRRWWDSGEHALWCGCMSITLCFVLLQVRMSSQMLEQLFWSCKSVSTMLTIGNPVANKRFRIWRCFCVRVKRRVCCW